MIEIVVAEYNAVAERAYNPKPVSCPDVEIARSIVRGLIASSRPFYFQGCGWICIRPDFGQKAEWYIAL